MKRLSLLLALVGLAVAAALVAWFDAGQVLRAALAVGWRGFLLLGLWQAGLFLLLGLAWTVVVPGVRPGRLVWGRMVRDAATTCLPFSPVGGFVIGARAVTVLGVPWPTAAAGTVVDVTAEIVAQALFSLFGLVVLVLLRPGSPLLAPAAAGLGLLMLVAAGAVLFRGAIGRLLRGLGGRLLATFVLASLLSIVLAAVVLETAFRWHPEFALSHGLGEQAAWIEANLAFDATGAPVALREPPDTAWVYTAACRD